MRISPSDNKKVVLGSLKSNKKVIKRSKKKTGRLRRFLVKVKVKVKTKIPSPFRQMKVHKTSDRTHKDFYKSIGNKAKVIVREGNIEEKSPNLFGKFRNYIVSVYEHVKKKIVRKKESSYTDDLDIKDNVKIILVLKTKLYILLKVREWGKETYLIKIPSALKNTGNSEVVYNYKDLKDDTVFLFFKKNSNHLTEIVKVLHLTPSSLLMRVHNRLIENVAILKKIQIHSNIIHVDYKNKVFLFSGVPLMHYVSYDKRVSENKKKWYRSRIFYVMKQIISGLAHIHSHGIAHLNINCNSIFVDKNYHVVITDFSLASNVKNGKITSDLMTNKKYLPCEALIKNAPKGCEIDVWSLGIVLFEFLSGKIFFKAEDIISETALSLNFATEKLFKLGNQTLLSKVQDYTDNKINELVKNLRDELPRRFSKRDIKYLKNVLSKMLMADEKERSDLVELSQHPLLEQYNK